MGQTCCGGKQENVDLGESKTGHVKDQGESGKTATTSDGVRNTEETAAVSQKITAPNKDFKATEQQQSPQEQNNPNHTTQQSEGGNQLDLHDQSFKNGNQTGGKSSRDKNEEASEDIKQQSKIEEQQKQLVQSQKQERLEAPKSEIEKQGGDLSSRKSNENKKEIDLFMDLPGPPNLRDMQRVKSRN